MGLASTLILAIFGTVVGLFLGVLLAFGRNIKINKNRRMITQFYKYPIIWFCSAYSTIIRGTPMMVQAMIFKYTCQIVFNVNWNLILPGVPVFDGWMIAGLVVITFNTAAYMCEIVRSGLNGVDNGQIEGAKSLGFTSLQTLFLVALPQAIKNSLPTIGSEFIVNIKDSSVLNVIGVTELYLQAQNSSYDGGYRTFASYIIIAIIYLICTLLANVVLNVLERKLDGKIVFSFLHSNKIKEL